MSEAQKARGTYQGPLHNLKGKSATLQVYDTGRCLAQFDDVATGYAFGWHDFETAHFVDASGKALAWKAQG